MSRKAVLVLVTLAAAGLAFALLSVSRAGKTDIYGTDHDLGSPANPTCAQCHIPHQAQGDYLWATTPYSYTGLDPELAESDLLPLCFSCHDGSVTPKGPKIIDPDYHNHPMGDTCYDANHNDVCPDLEDDSTDPNSCRDGIDNGGDGVADADDPDCAVYYPNGREDGAGSGTCSDGIDNGGDGVADADDPDCNPVDYPQRSQHPSYETSCKKCTQPDCIRCHDPHDNSWMFLAKQRQMASGPVDLFTAEYQDASFCTLCHSGSRHGVGEFTHPEVETNPPGTMDTLPTDYTWNGDEGDFSGTRLWDASGQNAVTEAPGDIRCKTCHNPHGAIGEELNTMPPSDPASNAAPICDNCHQ